MKLTKKQQAKQDVKRNLPIRYPLDKVYIGYYLNAIIAEGREDQ